MITRKQINRLIDTPYVDVYFDYYGIVRLAPEGYRMNDIDYRKCSFIKILVPNTIELLPYFVVVFMMSYNFRHHAMSCHLLRGSFGEGDFLDDYGSFIQEGLSEAIELKDYLL